MFSEKYRKRMEKLSIKERERKRVYNEKIYIKIEKLEKEIERLRNKMIY